MAQYWNVIQALYVEILYYKIILMTFVKKGEKKNDIIS